MTSVVCNKRKGEGSSPVYLAQHYRHTCTYWARTDQINQTTYKWRNVICALHLNIIKALFSSADTFGSIWISVRASRKALSSLPSFSCPWHLLNKAFESFGKISNATRKKIRLWILCLTCLITLFQYYQ